MLGGRFSTYPRGSKSLYSIVFGSMIGINTELGKFFPCLNRSLKKDGMNDIGIALNCLRKSNGCNLLHFLNYCKVFLETSEENSISLPVTVISATNSSMSRQPLRSTSISFINCISSSSVRSEPIFNKTP